MKTIKETVKVELNVPKSLLFDNRYVYTEKVSALLGELENKEAMTYKALRIKFYNSMRGEKYNVKVICGMRFIDAVEPMVAGKKASLELSFKITK